MHWLAIEENGTQRWNENEFYFLEMYAQDVSILIFTYSVFFLCLTLRPTLGVQDLGPCEPNET